MFIVSFFLFEGLIDANELMQFFESYKIKLSPEKVAEILKELVKILFHIYLDNEVR